MEGGEEAEETLAGVVRRRVRVEQPLEDGYAVGEGRDEREIDGGQKLYRAETRLQTSTAG